MRDPCGVRDIDMRPIKSFARLGLTPRSADRCSRHTEHQIGALRSALGC